MVSHKSRPVKIVTRIPQTAPGNEPPDEIPADEQVARRPARPMARRTQSSRGLFRRGRVCACSQVGGRSGHLRTATYGPDPREWQPVGAKNPGLAVLG